MVMDIGSLVKLIHSKMFKKKLTNKLMCYVQVELKFCHVPCKALSFLVQLWCILVLDIVSLLHALHSAKSQIVHFFHSLEPRIVFHLHDEHSNLELYQRELQAYCIHLRRNAFHLHEQHKNFCLLHP